MSGSHGRIALIAAYVAVSLLGLGAIGLFFSTLSDVPVGVMAAIAVVAVAAQIARGRCRSWSGCTRGCSPSTGTGFVDLLREPVLWDSFADNALLQAGYVLVFGALAYGRFATKGRAELTGRRPAGPRAAYAGGGEPVPRDDRPRWERQNGPMSMLFGPASSDPAASGLPRGEVLGTYDSYADARKVVDRLAAQEFDVRTVSIVGVDLRTVERIRNRLTYASVALRSALQGAFFGLMLGILMSLIDPSGAGIQILYTVGLGVGIWVLFGVIGHSIRKGRGFDSVQQLVPTRFDVVCEFASAPKARQILGGAARRPRPRPAPARRRPSSHPAQPRRARPTRAPAPEPRRRPLRPLRPPRSRPPLRTPAQAAPARNRPRPRPPRRHRLLPPQPRRPPRRHPSRAPRRRPPPPLLRRVHRPGPIASPTCPTAGPSTGSGCRRTRPRRSGSGS